MTAAPFNNMQVLVACNESSLREILKGHLLTMRYCVSTTGSGEAVLQKFSEKNFHMLISDMRMEKMDGLESGQKSLELAYAQNPQSTHFFNLTDEKIALHLRAV